MAIDSRQKRFNMLYFASPLPWGPLFEADGAVDADDRGHLLHLYSGNAFDNPIAVTLRVARLYLGLKLSIGS